MSIEINIAIIGCGRIADHHCKNIKKTKGLKIIAVCDLIKSKSKKLAKKYNILPYSNYKKMFKENPIIDCVVIATPSGMHYFHSKEIMNKYKKDIIIEKPTVIKFNQLKELYIIARKLNLKIFPVYQNRFNKAVQRVKKGLVNNELGKIYICSIRVRWCRPQRYYNMSAWRGTYFLDGGSLTNQGIHHLDLVRYLCSEVKSVSCNMSTLGSKIEVEDTVTGSLKFKNGAVGTIEVTTSARPNDYEASISLVCEKGMVQIGGIAVNQLQEYTVNKKICKRYSEDFNKDIYGNGHYLIYKDIYKTYSKGSKYFISEKDSINTLKLLNAFYVSDEKNSWIDTDDNTESKKLGKLDKKLIKLYNK